MPAPLVHGALAPHPPRRHHAPVRIASDTHLIRSVFGEGEGPVAVYVNSMVITGPDPIVVDTGTMVNREDWFRDLSEIVDLDDIRYVFLSHDDHDHVGNLVPLLEAAPQATVLTSWFSGERLAGDLHIPLERVRWLNDGDRFEAGGRTLQLVRPPLYDAPTTRGLFDTSTGVYWAVDTYGCPMVEPVEDVADLDPSFWGEWFMAFNRMNSPWSAIADPVLFGEQVERIERLGATVLASAHGPLVTGRFVEEAHRMMRAAAGGQAPPPPTQLDLEAMLAAVAREPELV